MNKEDKWEYFRGHTSKGVALSISKQLELEGVPNRIEAKQIENAVESEY